MKQSIFEISEKLGLCMLHVPCRGHQMIKTAVTTAETPPGSPSGGAAFGYSNTLAANTAAPLSPSGGAALGYGGLTGR